MKKYFVSVAAVVLLLCTACGKSNLQMNPDSTQDRPDTIEQQSVEVGSESCKASTLESIDLLDAALDRTDRASSEAEMQELAEEVETLFGDAGESMGVNCSQAEAGGAVSELILWSSKAASSRPLQSAAFAEGFLAGICNVDVELTPPAQIACSQ
ncbi:hypothetical protein [Leucobacter chinensis]|uniref:hypothetical protein n=1 Tax=Leucobacter chinensis TaxID=2851010 RepID=UPI001C2168ED|nr:hypothetical protein [Leucobacter chinensis]